MDTTGTSLFYTEKSDPSLSLTGEVSVTEELTSLRVLFILSGLPWCRPWALFRADGTNFAFSSMRMSLPST